MNGDPYYMMIDANMFLRYEFESMTSDAKLWFIKLLGNCNRLGVAYFYPVWKELGVEKRIVISELYNSSLVLEVNSMYAFIPDVLRANTGAMKGKYKSTLDMRGLQACMERYPEYFDILSMSQKKWLVQNGLKLPEGVLLIENNEAETSHRCNDEQHTIRVRCDIDQVSTIPVAIGNGEYLLGDTKLTDLDQKDYLKVLDLGHRFNKRYGYQIIEDRETMKWYLEKKHDNYRYKGKMIVNLGVLFENYLEATYKNKKNSGTLIPLGGNQ